MELLGIMMNPDELRKHDETLAQLYILSERKRCLELVIAAADRGFDYAQLVHRIKQGFAYDPTERLALWDTREESADA